MGTDDAMARQNIRTSSAMELTYFSQKMPVPAPEELDFLSIIYHIFDKIDCFSFKCQNPTFGPMSEESVSIV